MSKRIPILRAREIAKQYVNTTMKKSLQGTVER